MSKSVIVIFAVIAVGCDSGKVDKLEKQSQEILAQLQRQTAAQTYDLEAKCAQEAKRYFAENWQRDKTTAFLDYTNHYNRSLSKCLILVRHQTFMSTNNEWQIALTLSDVHERTDYGRFIESQSGTGGNPSTTCTVEGASCVSEQDFEKRATPFMSN